MHNYSSEYVSKEKRDSIIKYAAYSGGVSALNNILYKIDIALVTLLIADANLLATYKVATVVPENMNFIPSSILVVFLPLFIENEANKDWIVKKSRELFSYMAIVCGFISLLLVIFAGLAVRVLWGTQYLDAIPVFRILSLSFFFLGTFRSTSTNILQALGKVKFNFYVSIGVSISNVILDYILISQYGIMGAAIATLLEDNV